MPYYADDLVSVFHGDCLDVLPALPEYSVDAVVTDPPYGLGFMGKQWDSAFVPSEMPMRGHAALDAVNAGASRQGGRQRAGEDYLRRQARDARAYEDWCEAWARECLRVLKPGGHLLAFGGTRTYHRLACAVEDAGFEIRDSIAWLYGSGFPKSLDVSKAIDKAAGAEREVPATPAAERWQGWGTALKPAHEPIVVARKATAGTVAANVLAFGTGALNIDGCRIAGAPDPASWSAQRTPDDADGRIGQRTKNIEAMNAGLIPPPAARWPTNVLLDPHAAVGLDEQTRATRSRVGAPRSGPNGDGWGMTATGAEYDDEGGSSRFFPSFRYEAKAPTDERPKVGTVAHPTVKPLDLMRWLVRLVTPPGGTVLEPFAGSGTTAEACVVEGFRCIAIEREADYLPLIIARLSKPIQPDIFGASA